MTIQELWRQHTIRPLPVRSGTDPASRRLFVFEVVQSGPEQCMRFWIEAYNAPTYLVNYQSKTISLVDGDDDYVYDPPVKGDIVPYWPRVLQVAEHYAIDWGHLICCAPIASAYGIPFSSTPLWRPLLNNWIT